jgi:hypothetical protein
MPIECLERRRICLRGPAGLVQLGKLLPDVSEQLVTFSIEIVEELLA